MDLTLTEIQATILGGLEAKVTAALRDREVALAMVLAGHGIDKAEVVGINTEGRFVRIAGPLTADESQR